MPDLSYRPISNLLEEFGKKNPSKVAIVDVDQRQSITFGELAVAVDGIAHQLVKLGVCKGSRIVLLGENSLEKVVLWFGIWRAAAVVCPIDLNLISSAAESTLKAIKPDLIILDNRENTFCDLGGICAPIVHFSSWQSNITDEYTADVKLTFMSIIDEDDRHRLPSALISDLASMIFTSGTTGVPKIVVNDHLSYWENGQATIDFLGLTENDRILEYRSFGWYSPQILSMMPFLQKRLTMHVAKRFSYTHLPNWIEQYRVTVCAGVPTVINILIQQPVERATNRFSSLRMMTCSSAPISIAHSTRFEDLYGVPLIQLYGSSEMGWVCANRYDNRKLGTVGRPVKYVQFHILDDRGDPCPQGIAGQVVVSGEKLAVGYLSTDGHIDLIRGKPLSMPDRAVADEDGYVEITGRTDDIIIRGGIKISPIEIDEVLFGHADVFDAVTIGIPDPIYGQNPACFVILKPEAALDEATIITYCEKRLAREKVPRRIFIVESLPRSATGKILRKKLHSEYKSMINK